MVLDNKFFLHVHLQENLHNIRMHGRHKISYAIIVVVDGLNL